MLFYVFNQEIVNILSTAKIKKEQRIASNRMQETEHGEKTKTRRELISKAEQTLFREFESLSVFEFFAYVIFTLTVRRYSFF